MTIYKKIKCYDENDKVYYQKLPYDVIGTLKAFGLFGFVKWLLK